MYFDHAGSPFIDNDKFINDTIKITVGKTLQNPHSNEQKWNELITTIKHLTFKMFKNVNDNYEIIFTSGTTSSIKLIMDILKPNHLVHTISNHNSILGCRNLVSNITVINDNYEELEKTVLGDNMKTLIALPETCNFSGEKFNVPINTLRQKYNGYILLDIAKGITEHNINLEQEPEFLVFSYYKLFGYPTGLGALLIHKKMLSIINKQYFGGGTYDWVISEKHMYKPRETIKSFEDGTSNFLALAILEHALPRYISNRSSIMTTMRSLTEYARTKLSKAKYFNNEKIFKCYFPTNFTNIATINVLYPNREPIGFVTVKKVCEKENIFIRGGCMCNPGSCSKWIDLSVEEQENHVKKGHKCWSSLDLYEGKWTGAIRLSFGEYNTKEEIDKFIDIIKKSFDMPETKYISSVSNNPIIKDIYVYPIKGFNGVRVNKWKCTKNGLLWDRSLAIFDDKKRIITAKKNPKLLTFDISCTLDGWITIYKHNDNIFEFSKSDFIMFCIESEDYTSVNNWLSKELGEEITMVRNMEKSFMNNSPYLILNMQSFYDVNSRISQKSWRKYLTYNVDYLLPYHVELMQFRGNIILDNIDPYKEDLIDIIKCEDINIKSESECAICYTTTVKKQGIFDPNEEPIKTLSKYRSKTGKTLFGIFCTSDEGMISCGDIKITYKNNI